MPRFLARRALPPKTRTKSTRLRNGGYGPVRANRADDTGNDDNVDNEDDAEDG
jgi:hypothetical protein